MNAELCFGWVTHARFAPVHNRFAYPMFFLRLPLSQLSSVRLSLFGVNRCAPMRFDFRDHGARDGSSLLCWIRGVLQHYGLAAAADGEVVLHTMPRLFGYVFNPVSFWYCHDREGALRAVLCEVNNTFGERHNYIVAHPDQRPIRDTDVFWARKAFHVSPFFPVRGEYRFRFRSGGRVRSVSIDYFDQGVHMLSTCQAGAAKPLTDRTLAAALMRFPLMTLAVVWRIHWQALCLALRRVTFFRKPPPPASPFEETMT